MKKEGFTLLELLAVLVILSILVGLVVPKILSFIETSKKGADNADLATLNKATKLYASSNNLEYNKIFDDCFSDEERIDKLVSNGALNYSLEPNQEDAVYKWDSDNYIWYIEINGEVVLLTPYGNTFQEISPAIINLIIERKINTGSYGRTWGDYRYTDVGLVPEDWKNPILHLFYKPSGQTLVVGAESSYQIVAVDQNGEEIKVPYGWNIIYDVEDEVWYFKDVGNPITLDTTDLVVELK